jgi:hypothetical protein
MRAVAWPRENSSSPLALTGPPLHFADEVLTEQLPMSVFLARKRPARCLAGFVAKVESCTGSNFGETSKREAIDDSYNSRCSTRCPRWTTAVTSRGEPTSRREKRWLELYTKLSAGSLCGGRCRRRQL